MKSISEMLESRKQKGITGSVFMVVAGAIGLFVGIWVISLVIQSVNQGGWTAAANSTYATVQTTVFNSFTLLAVGLIVLAAAVIIGYFGMRKQG
jgi:hypothetical protein